LIIISLAKEDDLPQIIKIMQEAISPVWSSSALLNEMRKDDSYFIVAKNTAVKAEEPTSVLGFAVFRRVGVDGELLIIAVYEPARRKGVGDSLMQAVLDYAGKNAFKSVFLEVRGSNEAAVHLYEKHGFEQLRVRKSYYNDPVEDALVMARGDLR